jgi:threonine aldolase
MQPTRRPRQFASDNQAGICPEAWAAMAEANAAGHAASYGDDPWTNRAADLIRETFQIPRDRCEVFFVFNGTAANSLALSHICQSYHSILCHEISHVETDECGAPEFFSNGTKLLLLTGDNGKIDPSAIDRAVRRRTDIHYPKPKVVSITQATELGTVYRPEEVRAISMRSKSLGLRLHMDGARFANAVASLHVPPKAVTWEAGVDVLSLGGSKNGGPLGEAVVFFDMELAAEFDYRCKQAGQLASKMRFLAAPWIGMLEGSAWLKHAKHANDMAALLESEIRRLPHFGTGVRILFPRQANSVFVQLPEHVISVLRDGGWNFYTFIGRGGCRLMCSWDTTAEDLHALAADMREALVTVGAAGETPPVEARPPRSYAEG